MLTQKSTCRWEHLSFLHLYHPRPGDDWGVITFFYGPMFPFNSNKPTLCADTTTAKYSCYLLNKKEEAFSLKWCINSQNRLFDLLGIIFNICFYLCQDLLTLQTVPFHYLHTVLPLQVNVNVSYQLCWFYRMSNPEKLKLESLTEALRCKSLQYKGSSTT